jgi:DNA anti-recombination protein RmuC
MLASIFEAAFLDPLNRGFCSAIVALTTMAILGTFVRGGMLSRLTPAAPALLTAIGVLGTFVGILIGLLQFDVADISRSVPLLLEGMKTAFVTSVFGMAGGILVKLVSEVATRSEATNESKGVEDVLASLDAVRKEGEQTRRDLVTSLDRVRVALTGDNESSLVTQLQRMRTDVTDEIKASRKANAELIGTIAEEIRKISTTLTENTSKAIIEALERSIRDFNQKITEQFGENFKQLNIAVGRLLEWQENYRQQMIANAEALRQAADGIQGARTGMDAIGQQAGAMVRAAADMQTLLEGLGQTRAELDARLQAFQSMAAAAAAAMPTIQAKLEELTTGFSRQVEAATQQVAKITEDMQGRLQVHEQSLQTASSRFVEAVGDASTKASETATRTAETMENAFKAVADEMKLAQTEQNRMLADLSQGYARLREDAAAVGADLRTTLTDAGDTLRKSLSDAAADLQKVQGDSVRAVGQQLQRTADEQFRQIAESLKDQVTQLDTAMQRELENALTDLGTQLVSLTRKFVDDYRILADAMRDAVSSARLRP